MKQTCERIFEELGRKWEWDDGFGAAPGLDRHLTSAYLPWAPGVQCAQARLPQLCTERYLPFS